MIISTDPLFSTARHVTREVKPLPRFIDQLAGQIAEHYSRIRPGAGQASIFANPAHPSKAWREELHPRDHGKFTDKAAKRGAAPDLGVAPKPEPTQGEKKMETENKNLPTRPNSYDDAGSLLENERVSASFTGEYIRLTLKVLGKTITIGTQEKPQPVTEAKYLNALKAKGIDANTRRVYGTAVIPTEDAEAIYNKVQQLPSVRWTKLENERDFLATEASGAIDEAHLARQRAIERASETGIYRPAKHIDTENPAVALKKFDAEHPEIIANLKREREENTARHIWD